jgi:hypothetical protein
MKKYAKGIAAATAAVLVALGAALSGNNHIDPTEWVTVAIAGAGAISVWVAANVNGASYVKGAIAFITAGLVVLQTSIVGGVTYTEWIQIALAALGAIGVVAIKNVDESGRNLSYTGSVE